MTSLRQLYCQECKSRGLVPNSELIGMLPDDDSLISSTSVLHLGCNFIGDRGLSPLLIVIPKVTSLHTLNLRGNGIGNEAVKELCRALRFHPSLKVLELSENPFTYLAAKHLVHLYEDNDSLSFIGMDDTLMTPRFKASIHRRMQEALHRKTERRVAAGKLQNGSGACATPGTQSHRESPAAPFFVADAALPEDRRRSSRQNLAGEALTFDQNSNDSLKTSELTMQPPLASHPAPQPHAGSTDDSLLTDEGVNSYKDKEMIENASGVLTKSSPSNVPLSMKYTDEPRLADNVCLEVPSDNRTENCPSFLLNDNNEGQDVPCSDKDVTDVSSMQNNTAAYAVTAGGGDEDDCTKNLGGEQVNVQHTENERLRRNSQTDNDEKSAVENEVPYDDLNHDEEDFEGSGDDCSGEARNVGDGNLDEKEFDINFCDFGNEEIEEASIIEVDTDASPRPLKEEPEENTFLDMLFND